MNGRRLRQRDACLLVRVLPAEDRRRASTNLFDTISALRDARARLRLGHLRRRRLDPRADARPGRPHPARDGDRGRWPTSPASANARGALRDPRPASRGRHRERARPARRPAPRREPSSVPTPGGLRLRRRSSCRAGRASGVVLRRRAPASPRGTSRPPTSCSDLANLRRKVDAGADFLITQLFFDNDALLRLRRPGAGRGHRRADHRRDHADHEPRADRALHRDVRRVDPARPARAGCSVRRDDPRRSSTSASPTRRCSAPTCSPRRAGHPLLHAQPLARRPGRSSRRCGSPAPGRSRP